jgi:hypothetical protein
MDRYSIFYRHEVSESQLRQSQYDLFLSAFTLAPRALHVYDNVPSDSKIWIVFPHFGFDREELPSEKVCEVTSIYEQDFVADLLNHLPSELQKVRICVDVTGFIRPHLMFLVKWLAQMGVRQFDAIYAEPQRYLSRESTEFSPEIIDEVRQVAGFEGNHTPDASNDFLIIGVGYQDHLISQVAQNKARAQKVQLFGFPPLRADMYQENVLKVHGARESLGTGKVNDYFCSIFAPAADPFVTASVLSHKIKEIEASKPITNLYLCPLATKAQVLGFTIFYLTECVGRSASIIFPFESSYSKSTSVSNERVWKYTIELPSIRDVM